MPSKTFMAALASKARTESRSARSSPRSYADDLATLLDTLDLKKAILIGFSAGGGEVARYIGRHGTKRLAKRSTRARLTASRKRTRTRSTPTCSHSLRPETLCRRHLAFGLAVKG
jgi:pimeloyl-ACP methyl ester carboxylesterase